MTHENKTPTKLRSSPEDWKKVITETTQNEMNNFCISETKTKLAILIVSDSRLQKKPSTCQNHSHFYFEKRMFV